MLRRKIRIATSQKPASLLKNLFVELYEAEKRRKLPTYDAY
jgi:hypothetical protein